MRREPEYGILSMKIILISGKVKLVGIIMLNHLIQEIKEFKGLEQ